MKHSGVVSWFNDSKGFGFIKHSVTGVDVFVQITGILGTGFRTLPDSAHVEFELVETDRGPMAINVRVMTGV